MTAFRGCFITGTDTDVGKTNICLALIEVLKRRGIRVAAMKPVASGGLITGAGVRNRDAQLLLEHMNTEHDYATVNPYALSLPAAPIFAAKEDGIAIESTPVLESFQILSRDADVVLVEGVGGWHIDLSEDLCMSDIVKMLDLPVLMVVGMRLGCINHARLTAEAIHTDGCWLAGWISNQIDPEYRDLEATRELLSISLASPMLAAVPYVGEGDVEKMADFLDNIEFPEIGLVREPGA